ncbi:YitT family protein [Salipaludibacillus agaradhaerens]|uniref:YitT family protein n=1 Tax=Salipaludibacillus agaradhaerens TaxID=76935 RepID=A0A9Q4AZK6_SALAG|nr:YitT family protein [Salipaludibacillus agaradhaerens]MCR6095574.1 YitT family protein [Salipaludibacillus agaradhaerens]MCR6114866.1 YitT family protein [Salipaludibacillus agaradhaerens]
MQRGIRLLVIFIASIVIGVAFNLFLLPHEVLTGGVTGLAMVFGLMTPVNTGYWIVLLNAPIFVLGWMKLGREFIGNSIFSVLITSISMLYIPIIQVTEDALLSSVFGGVIAGAAIGVIIRFYSSTGGFDIVSLVLIKKWDVPLGGLIFALNSVVVFISAFFFAWDLALYTMLSIYITGIVIDRVHTRHVKLSLMVVTSKGDKLKQELLANLVRGITVIDGRGAYSGEDKKVLYTVITRYELAIIRPILKEIDPQAFVSVSESMEVMGNFRRD